MRTVRGPRLSDGMPIEEAPVWALAILVALFALIFFPALVGLAESFGADTRGHRLEVAAGAAALALFLVVGLARQRRWRRARSPLDPLDPLGPDERPFFARFSTWLWTTLLFPSVLYGLLVLTHSSETERVDPRAAWIVGLGVSALQGLWALALRRRGRAR